MEFEGADPAAMVVDHTLAIEHVISTLPPKSGLELLSFVRRRMDAAEAGIVADRYEAGATDRNVEELLREDGKTSKAGATKRARRGKATNANPDIAARIASGNLSTEQADLIADAAEETDGEAACDETLLDDVSSTTPEQGKKKATAYVNKRKDAGKVQTRHDRQKRRRGWYRHRLSNGNSAITFHGTDESIDDIEKHVKTQADAEYRKDGGRDVPSAKHPRTADQRGFDAAHTLITNPNPSQAKDRRSGSGQRTAVFVKATVGQLTGADISPFTTIDGKPLPTSMVEEIACGSDFIAQIFSADGELLWQGLKTRLATPAQVTGLIARDGGCVLCGASYDKCVAHHLVPWEAPQRGPTDIDNLAFVCDDCHHRIHQRKQLLYYERKTRTWKLRAATWNETAPDNQHAPSSKPAAYKRPPERHPTSGPHEPEPEKPRLDEQRQNARRHDPHGNRLF